MLLPEVKKHYGKLKLLIDGEWVDSRSRKVEIDTNPATDEAIAEFPNATKEEAIRAVEAAHRAFITSKRSVVSSPRITAERSMKPEDLSRACWRISSPPAALYTACRNRMNT